MNTRRWVIALAGACCAVAMIVVFDRSAELKSAREQLAAMDASRTRPRTEDREVGRLRSQIAERQREIALLKARLEENRNGTIRDGDVERAVAEPGIDSGEYEAEIESWLRRIDRLAEYLELSESLRIPELEHLKARDWLDATNSVSLETEADFRAALALLRRQAKWRVAPMVAAALRSYLEASGGEKPARAAQLLEHLDPAIDRSILERYRIVPSAEAGASGKTVLMEDLRPDALYYTAIKIGVDGSIASYSSQGTETIEKAISRFEEEHGRRPTSAAELMPYYKRDLEVELVEEEFRAVNTRIRLPSEGG